jgi:hypothetical protein
MGNGAKTSRVKTMMIFSKLTSCFDKNRMDSERFIVEICTVSALKIVIILGKIKIIAFIFNSLY